MDTSLISHILPAGVLDYFDLINIEILGYVREKQDGYFIYLDEKNAYYFDLQNIKLLQWVERDSVVYMNSSTGNQKLLSLISDRYKPLFNYVWKRENNEYDFKFYAPLFIALRGKIDSEYWWYKMEQNNNLF